MQNISGHGAPDKYTEGVVGQQYTNLDDGKVYECVQIHRYTVGDSSEIHYVWDEVYQCVPNSSADKAGESKDGCILNERRVSATTAGYDMPENYASEFLPEAALALELNGASVAEDEAATGIKGRYTCKIDDRYEDPDHYSPDLNISLDKNIGAAKIYNDGAYPSSSIFLSFNGPDKTYPEFDVKNGFTIDFSAKIDSLPLLSETVSKSASPFQNAKLGWAGFVVSAVSNVKPVAKGFILSFANVNTDDGETCSAVTLIGGDVNDITSFGPSFSNIVTLPIADGKFHRYTLVCHPATPYTSGNNFVFFYVDGKFEARFVVTDENQGRVETPNYVSIGSRCTNDFDGEFPTDVYVDCVRCYNGVDPMSVSDRDVNTGHSQYDIVPYGGVCGVFTRTDTARIDRLRYIKEEMSASGVYTVKDVDIPVDYYVKPQSVVDALANQLERNILAAYKASKSAADIRIAFDYSSDGKGYPYAWTNSSILFTEVGYDTANYQPHGDLAYFASVVFTVCDDGTYEVDNIYPAKTPMVNRITVVESGKAILYIHPNDTSVSTSSYASQAFGDANQTALASANVGDVYQLVGYTDSARTGILSLGKWRSRYDPNVGVNANGTIYPYHPTKTKGSKPARDYFDNFVSLTFFKKISD